MTTRKKKKRAKPPSARELFERCADQIETLNRRYAALFEFVQDPGALAQDNMHMETIPVVLDQDMKAGHTLMVRVPRKFRVRS